MKALGAAIILLGMACMFYVGIYLMLVGGIMGIVNYLHGADVSLAWSIVQVVLFECGLIPGWFMVIFGIGIIANSESY